MENIQKISLDIMDNQVYEYAYAKQYDEGRILRFTVSENGIPYNLNGVLATFQAKKPDDTVVLNSVSINDDTNVIDVELTLQTTILAGKVPYQIQLIKDDVVISTVTGYLKVDKSVVDVDDVESSDEFNALVDALRKANEDYTYVMDNARKSADVAKSSEVNSKMSEANAKASADLASTKANDANNSANAAKTSADNAKKSEDAAKNSQESAKNSAATATNKAQEALDYAKVAESYAHGGTNTREGEDDDNAKKYKEICEEILAKMQSGQVTGVKGYVETKYRYGDVNIAPSDIGFEIISETEPELQENGSYWVFDY